LKAEEAAREIKKPKTTKPIMQKPTTNTGGATNLPTGKTKSLSDLSETELDALNKKLSGKK
jgi:hypothetical protein